jgi:hypothetical protein
VTKEEDSRGRRVRVSEHEVAQRIGEWADARAVTDLVGRGLVPPRSAVDLSTYQRVLFLHSLERVVKGSHTVVPLPLCGAVSKRAVNAQRSTAHPTGKVTQHVAQQQQDYKHNTHLGIDLVCTS